MIDAFDSLWEQSRPAFEQERTWRRARALALSTLVGLGRHTITGLLTTSAQQGVDGSAAYRLFDQERFDAGALFAPARRSVCSRLGEKEPSVVLMSGSCKCRRRCRKVPALVERAASRSTWSIAPRPRNLAGMLLRRSWPRFVAFRSR